MDLTEFLRARISGDEMDAESLAHGISKWRHEQDVNGPDGLETSIIIAGIERRDHAANPARLLAEVAAKRAIIGEHLPDLREGRNQDGDERESIGCLTCLVEDDYPCPTLLALAQAYAEHPDFDPAWLSR